jgi:hypothetical protein
VAVLATFIYFQRGDSDVEKSFYKTFTTASIMVLRGYHHCKKFSSRDKENINRELDISKRKDRL